MFLFDRSAWACLMAVGLVAVPAAAQTFNQFDTSANAALHGNYFVREVLLTNVTAQGTVGDALSAVGTMTFDGAGNYTFVGSVMESNPTPVVTQPTARTITGKYSLADNGFLRIDSIVGTVDSAGTADEAYGGVGAAGPNAFVASTTESPVPNYDLIVGIPMGTVTTNASFRGTFNAAYLGLTGGDIAKVRNATFQLRPNGTGNLGDVTFTGYAAEQNSTDPNSPPPVLNQTVASATYSLATVASTGGVLTFGTSANLISGNQAFMVSQDGTLIVGGSPSGFDMLVGTPAVASATADMYKGFYFLGGLENDSSLLSAQGQSTVDTFYGSSSVTGAGGVFINHLRFLQKGFFPYDDTYDDYYDVPASGIFTPQFDSDQYTLGAGGKVVIMSGQGEWYSLMVGLQAATPSGSGVFLNPLGVVNAANFAPATNPVAPLEMVALFGTGLATNDFDATTLPVPTETTDHVQVLVNGTPAPIFRVRAGTNPQLMYVLVPSSITPANSVYYATFQVKNNGTGSNSVTMYTNYTAPGVFATSQAGIGDAAALHARAFYSVVSASDPAAVSETVELFVDGLGSVFPLITPDGAGAPTVPPFSKVDATTTINIGNWNAALPFVGMAPGYTGLYQVNVAIPTVSSGDYYMWVDAYDNTSGDGGLNVESKIPISGTASGSAVRSQSRSARTPVRAMHHGTPSAGRQKPVSGRMTHTAQ